MSEDNGELPQGWAEAKLKDLADLITKGSTPTTYGHSYQTSGIPFVRVEHMRDGIIRRDLIKEFIDEAADETLKRSRLQNEDVLFSLAGTIGRTAIVRECDVPANTNQAVGIVRGISKFFMPVFLRMLLSSQLAQDRMSRRARGGAMMNVSLGDLKDLSTPIPPLPEQRRIVAKIEALQERSARAREALREVGPLLEQFRQSVLQAAFSGRLTADWRAANPNTEPATELLARIRTQRRQRWEQSELSKYQDKGKQPPKDWQDKYQEPEPTTSEELAIFRDDLLPDNWLWAPAELIVEPDAEIVYGIVQPGKQLEEGVPYVRGKDIIDGEILVNQLLKTSPKIAAKYERASLKGGDILLGIIRATKVAIVPDVLDGANITQGTARFRPSSILSTKFLAGWLDSPQAQHWLHEHYRGIDMPGLNLRDVRRLPIPIAPVPEQREVESLVTKAIESIQTASQISIESESSLTQLDQSILAKAFRGELVPQDPTDEPASALLERIRKQREEGSGERVASNTRSMSARKTTAGKQKG